MRDGRCAGEGQFEGGFEQEAAEDHEVVSVAVLRLHDLHGLDRAVAHARAGFGEERGGVGI